MPEKRKKRIHKFPVKIMSIIEFIHIEYIHIIIDTLPM